MRFLISAAVCAAMAMTGGACGGETDDPGEPGDPPEAETIEFSKSGGFAGISESIEIEPSGEATVSLGFAEPQEKTFSLSDTELEQLNSAFDKAGFEDVEVEGGETGCADCFEYEITRSGHTVSFDDVQFPEELGPVVTQLDGLIAAHSEPVTPVKGGA